MNPFFFNIGSHSNPGNDPKIQRLTSMNKLSIDWSIRTKLRYFLKVFFFLPKIVDHFEEKFSLIVL